VDFVRLINNLICALGSLTVALAMLVLLWLPSRPFVRLQINLTADSQPVALNISGYEALMMANGLMVIPAKAGALLSELQSQPNGALFAKPYELSERQQGYLRDVADGTSGLFTPLVAFQIAFFVLPALTLLMAWIVATTRGYFGEQLFRGILLIALAAAAVLVMTGGTLYLSERLNAVIAASLAQNQAGFPGLGMPVNDALPELRVGLLNLIDTRTPIIAAGVALIGAVVAMLGGGAQRAQAGTERPPTGADHHASSAAHGQRRSDYPDSPRASPLAQCNPRSGSANRRPRRQRRRPLPQRRRRRPIRRLYRLRRPLRVGGCAQRVASRPLERRSSAAVVAHASLHPSSLTFEDGQSKRAVVVHGAFL
jgi:hypothetical protein